MKLFMKLQSGISFKNPDPYSPRLNHKFHQNRGFSGPIIPEEARRRNINKFDDNIGKEEPTSPKISCMGQIKQKKKKIINKTKTKTKTTPLPPKQENPFSREHPGSGFWTSRAVHDSGRPLYGSDEKGKKRWPQDVSGSDKSRLEDGGAPPRLGQLKKFASGRETLSKYDWKTTQEEGEQDELEEEVIIPFSAPILMIGGVKPVVQLEKKKEINLWKRRTLAQPQPLHLT